MAPARNTGIRMLGPIVKTDKALMNILYSKSDRTSASLLKMWLKSKSPESKMLVLGYLLIIALMMWFSLQGNLEW